MLLDMHIVHALTNGWKAYRDSLEAFRELLPSVSEDVAATWHATLVAHEPVFRVAHAPRTPEAFPFVTVELLSDTPSERSLGNFTGMHGGRRMLGFSSRQTASITIESKQDETLRALAIIIRAVLLRATTSFLRSSYVSFQYEGMDPLGMDEQLVAESFGIYTRHLQYSAEVEIHIPEQLPGVVVPDIGWFVQLENVVEDPAREPATGAGVPGGVTPLTD